MSSPKMSIILKTHKLMKKMEKKGNEYSRILNSKQQQKIGNIFISYLHYFTQLTVTDNKRRKLLTMPITKLTLQGK